MKKYNIKFNPKSNFFDVEHFKDMPKVVHLMLIIALGIFTGCIILLEFLPILLSFLILLSFYAFCVLKYSAKRMFIITQENVHYKPPKLDPGEFHSVSIRAAEMRLKYPQLRKGQSLMNSLCELFPEVYESVVGTNNDPFYEDGLLKRFISYVTNTKD